jgi:hypothetical protein
MVGPVFKPQLDKNKWNPLFRDLFGAAKVKTWYRAPGWALLHVVFGDAKCPDSRASWARTVPTVPALPSGACVAYVVDQARVKRVGSRPGRACVRPARVLPGRVDAFRHGSGSF